MTAQTPAPAALPHTEAFKYAALALEVIAQALETGETLTADDFAQARVLITDAARFPAEVTGASAPQGQTAPHPAVLRYAAALLDRHSFQPLPDPRETGREPAPGQPVVWACHTLAAALSDALQVLGVYAAQAAEGGQA